MTLSIKTIKETKFKETMVMLPLRQYDALMEYLEDIEDRLTIIQRTNEPNYDFKKLVKKLDKKFNLHRSVK